MAKQSSPRNKFIRFIGLGFQLGATIYFAVWIGKKLDAYFGYEKAFTFGVMIFAFIGTMYSIIKQLNKIQDN